jgi:hypothetical protein
VTAYVDGALGEAERALIEEHLVGCKACRAQAAVERELKARLRALPPVEPAAEFEQRVRAVLKPRRRVLPWLGALAASLVLLLLWGRKLPVVMAWELAQDHAACHAVRVLDVADDEAGELRDVPREAGGLPLVGASLCELKDGTLVVHAQYGNDESRVSMFLVDADRVRLGHDYSGTIERAAVRLLTAHGRVFGIVCERPQDAEAVSRAIRSRSDSA